VNQESRQFTFAPDARSDLRASVLRNAFSPQPKYPRLRVASQFKLPNRALPETRIGDLASSDWRLGVEPTTRAGQMSDKPIYRPSGSIRIAASLEFQHVLTLPRAASDSRIRPRSVLWT
jgi:hypothetical protein